MACSKSKFQQQLDLREHSRDAVTFLSFTGMFLDPFSDHLDSEQKLIQQSPSVLDELLPNAQTTSHFRAWKQHCMENKGERKTKASLNNLITVNFVISI